MTILSKKLMKFKYQIDLDPIPESPRSWDNAWKLVLAHKRYYLSNEIDFDFDSCRSWDEVYKELVRDYKHVLPVYLYEHSQLHFGVGKPSCPWDSGYVGFAVLSQDAINDYGINDESENDLIESLNLELDAYTNFCNGNVYMYEIFDSNDDLLDDYTSYGFYSIKDAIEDAESSIQCLEKEGEGIAWESLLQESVDTYFE